jgi:hypothetical protein
MFATKTFQIEPAELELGLQAALGLSGQILGECRARGIAPVFVYLPSWYELDPDVTVKEFASVMTLLELTRDDVARAAELGERYLEGLRALGAHTVDLRPSFRERAAELYWHTDHHLNLAGHALVARELLHAVESAGFDEP